MALPREPRQKMINMMYLVLTALLALNVSAEILNAFKTVNKSLENTNEIVDKSTTTIMTSLQQKLSDPSTAAKAQIWLPKAQQMVVFSKTMFDYIQGLKNDIIKKGGGDVDKSSFKADNLDIVTRMMIDKGKGKELLKRLGDFKTDVLTKIDPSIDSAFRNSLSIDLNVPKGVSKSNRTWERAYFHMVPTVAALTILSKFQNDVKTSENRIVQFCHNKVGEVIVRNDAFAAIAVANANYVLPGQEIIVTAGVGGFSTSVKPEISINGAGVPIGPDGTATSKITSGALGQHSISVHFVYTDQDGNRVPIDKTIEYTVGQSAASIALDKMNVLYIGVDNPVSISATAGGAEKLQVSIQGGGGSITGTGGGHYIARVSSQTEDCRINVSVDGKAAGSGVFRVRSIPEAQAYVGGQPSGASVTAGAFKAQGGVGAGIKNFPFELSYDVVSFTFTCDTDDDIISVPSSGAAFAGAVRNAIQQHVQAGRTVTIDNIRVKGPDGRTNSAPSLVYYIK